MDLTVLDMQRAVLGQLYQTHSWRQNLENHNQSDPDSVMDRRQIPPQLLHAYCKPDLHCDSSFLANGEATNPKKRKAEVEVEDETKGKRAAEEEAGEEKSEITTKTGRGISCSKDVSKVSEVQKPDYIHVRARRGQATDSHSLAERARREKISNKMKCLQDLVPGCNKVTGKAGMLDEIINYVQSLQKQVEFLSMKLAAVNPRLDCCIDNIFAKEMQTYIASVPAATQFESPNSNRFQYDTMQQGTSICGLSDIPFDQSQILSHKPGQNSEGLLDSSFLSQLQQLSGWESDLPNLFN